MAKKKVFIKSFSDGEISEERVDKPFSAARLENFISDEESTYYRSGFELICKTHNSEKAKIVKFKDKIIEFTSENVRAINKGFTRYRGSYFQSSLPNSIKEVKGNVIVIDDEYDYEVGDSVYFRSKHSENSTKVNIIHKVKRIISKTSFELFSTVSNDVITVVKIYGIELKINSSKLYLDIENLKHTISNEKLHFLDISDIKLDPYTIYYCTNYYSFSYEEISIPLDYFRTKVMGYYENRLILASGNTICFSTVDEPRVFGIGTYSSAPMIYELNFGIDEEIVFCHPALRTLVIGTNRSIYMAISSEGFLAPGKVVFKKISSYGAESTNPVSIGDSLIYIEKGGRFIRMILYNDDTIQDFHLTEYATHFKNLKKIIINRQKREMLNILSSDGYILNMILKRDNSGKLYGSFSKIKRSVGKFYDIETIEGDDGYDILYAVVERHGKYYIERSTQYVELPELYDYQDEEKYVESLKLIQPNILLLDSALIYDGYRKYYIHVKDDIATCDRIYFAEYMIGDYLIINEIKVQIREIITERSVRFFSEKAIPEKEYKDFYYCPKKITNLSYLEGEKVSILADGGVLEDQIIKDGELELSREVKKCHIGIKYEGILVTQPLVLNDIDLFSNKNITKVYLRLKHSRNFYAGYSLTNLQQISFSGYNFKNAGPTPLYTGDIELNLQNSGWDTYIRLYIKNNSPTPLKITGLYYEIIQ